jgi:hypothetical protein
MPDTATGVPCPVPNADVEAKVCSTTLDVSPVIKVETDENGAPDIETLWVTDAEMEAAIVVNL